MNDPIQYNRESHILVVDDDNTLLKFFKIHLNKFFSKVVVAKNAKEAIVMLKEREVDLVISDIRMPRMDGIQLMARVRKYDPTIPVLLITGAAFSPEEEEEAQANSDGFLKKPFTIEELHDFVESGVERREKLKRLKEIIESTKSITSLLDGKGKIDKLVPADFRDEVTTILEQLKDDAA